VAGEAEEMAAVMDEFVDAGAGEQGGCALLGADEIQCDEAEQALSQGRVLQRMHALPFAVVALALWTGAAQAQLAIDRKLVDAGFVMRSVDTPKQIEQARRLPQRTIVSRGKGAQLHYIYADTDYCKCVLAGNAQALQAYRDMALPPPAFPADATAPRGINPESLVIRDMDADFTDLEPDDILSFRF